LWEAGADVRRGEWGAQPHATAMIAQGYEKLIDALAGSLDGDMGANDLGLASAPVFCVENIPPTLVEGGRAMKESPAPSRAEGVSGSRGHSAANRVQPRAFGY
jgi:hypothetical protein